MKELEFIRSNLFSLYEWAKSLDDELQALKQTVDRLQKTLEKR